MIGWGAAMPAGKKQAAEAKVKTEPADDATGVKRERPAEEAEGGAAAKHVKVEPKAEPHRSAGRAGRRCGRCICARRAAPARACAWGRQVRRGSPVCVFEQQRSTSAPSRARARGSADGAVRRGVAAACGQRGLCAAPR